MVWGWGERGRNGRKCTNVSTDCPFHDVHNWKSRCPDIQVAIASWEARIRWALVMTVLEADMCSLDLRIGVTSSVDMRNTSWRRFESVVFVRKGRRDK